MDETITAVKHHQGVLNQSDCPEEVKNFIHSISDGLLCEWLYICALDGMELEQLKKLNGSPIKDSFKKAIFIQNERQKFLARKYQGNPETLQQMKELRQKVREIHEESRQLRHTVDTSLRDAVKQKEEMAQKQEKSLYNLVGVKNEQIKERDQKITQLQEQLQELTKQLNEAVSVEKTIPVENREENGAHHFSTKKRKWPWATQRDASRTFIKRYLENDAYTKEQREFLIQCLEEGDTVKEMEQYAVPALSVDMMGRLRKLIIKQE